MGDWCTYGARDGYALPMVLTVRLPFNNLLFFGRSFGTFLWVLAWEFCPDQTHIPASELVEWSVCKGITTIYFNHIRH